MKPSAKALIADAGFARLKHYVIEATGLAYYQGKDEELAGLLAARLVALGLQDCRAYQELLDSREAGEAELDALVGDLTIGETSFFRHREQFEALNEIVLPELIRRNQPRRQLRIWSAGCATGAEPYSLAILLDREWGHLLEDWEVTILATDINRGYLAAAQRGEFNDWAFRGATEDLKQSCFSHARGKWIIAAKYRQRVTFQYHNLVQHPFPSLLHNLFAFDLILCRNVMIYFSPEIIAGAVTRFHDCLSDEGWLLVGHAESNVDLFRDYETINYPGAVLYRKASRSLTLRVEPPDSESQATVTDQYRPVSPRPAADFGETRLHCAPAARTAELVTSTTTSCTWEDLRASMDAGECDEALARCRWLLERDPLSPRGHFYQALLLARTAAHAEAEQSLGRAIYLDRSFVLAHYYLAQLQRKRGDAAAARRSFTNVLRLLAAVPHRQVLADADGLTASELRKLAHMHLELLPDDAQP